MQILHQTCCGIDVHAKMLVACLIRNKEKQIRTFSTMTDSLLELRAWLLSNGCRQVAIESTGVYWKPVFNILESALEVVLVNAKHIKAVPGRKTDVRDCEWLCELLRHGLVRASFIPPAEIRALREMTRYRQSLAREKTAVANRILKLIESANIKLAQVASDALGKSGRAMLRALAQAETDIDKLVELARGKLKEKRQELSRALNGRLTETQRLVLSELLNRLDELESADQQISQQIVHAIEQNPKLALSTQLLISVPGIGVRVAQIVVAEIGVDMQQFGAAQRLSSWAGLCPGQNESAGKRRSGKTRPGNSYLRSALVQAAWAAAHTKQTHLALQYKRLARRIGCKRALVAVAHSLLVIIYHILNRQQSYTELGADYFDYQQVERHKSHLIRKLESLGVKVTVEQQPVG